MALQERALTSTQINNPEKERPTRPAALARAEILGHELWIREFDLPPEVRLTKEETRVLELLTRAARRVAYLYALQEKDIERFGFYPHGIKKPEIQKQAKENPEILSPFTVVELAGEGKLLARPTIEVFRSELDKRGIIDLLKEAAKEAGRGKNKNPQLRQYLEARANAFRNGDVKSLKESVSLWLSMKPEPMVDSEIDIGDTYTDTKLGIKYSWQAWVDVLHPQLTEDLHWFTKVFWEYITGETEPPIKTRVGYPRIMTGQAGKYLWSGQSQPCLPEWQEEMGSKQIILLTVFEKKFRRRLESLRQYVDPDQSFRVRTDFIRLATLRKHVGHETVHHLIRAHAKNLAERLQQHTAWVKELYCDLYALAVYRSLSNRRLVSTSESEMAMAMVLADSWIEYQDREERKEYHEASTVLLNYLLERGSVHIDRGTITWHETPAVFEDIKDLLDEVHLLIMQGNLREASDLYNRYFKPETYKFLMFKETYSPANPLAAET